MNDLIKACLKPKRILYIFTSFRELRNWVNAHGPQAMEAGAEYNRLTTTFTFRNGAVLMLGHAINEYDLDKFRGIEYNLVIGFYDEQLKIRETL